MEPLSRNKKIGIFSLVILGLTVVGLSFTGTMSFSWLKSDVFNQSEYICTEKGQITNKGAYNKAIKSRDNTTNTINLRKSEITVLENKIATNQTLVAQKKSQVETKKSTVKDLQAYISKNCVGTLKPTVQKICNQKRQQLQKAQSDIAALTQEILFLTSEVKKFEQQIATKTQNIRVLEAKREADVLFITQYELCDRQLKVKPLLTSPKMSGEARMSGELLVSGEICMSSEVIISGEVHVSGEVNAPVYRLAITEEYPGKATVEGIDYDISQIDANTLQISDWFVAEEGTANILYKCSFMDANKTQLRCLPGTKALVQSETRNYILYAKVKTITGPGVFKVYGANIAYNGGKIDATNRTTTISIKYGEKPTMITEIRYDSQFGKKGMLRGDFDTPHSIALDANDNIFVADTINNRIQKFDSQGKIVWDNRGYLENQFSGPKGITIDSSGHIYVADTGKHRIQKYANNGQFLSKFGTQGTGNGQLSYPSDTAIDKSGNIYVADSYNNRIQKFDSQGKYLSQIGAHGSDDGQLNNPTDVEIDRFGNIYVVDQSNHRIQKFDSQGKFLFKMGTNGTSSGVFNTPRQLKLDNEGNIYVVEQNNHRIQKFDSQGRFITKFGLKGSENGYFNSPRGIALDSHGNIFVSDTNNHRIQKFREVAVCGNAKPSITVLSPNGGEVFIPGQIVGVQTKNSDKQEHSVTHYLVPSPETPIPVSTTLLFDKNAGGYHWGGMQTSVSSPHNMVIPLELPIGSYKVRAYIGEWSNTYGSPTPQNAWGFDESDTFFKIVASSSTYSWMLGPWSACVDKIQTRVVICQNNSGVLVTDLGCPAPKPAETKTCSVDVVTYDVTYNINGASGVTPLSQIKIHDVPLILANNTTNPLARTGYTFAGWNTAADGSGVNYAPGASYTANVSVTLYAKWIPISISCTDSDGGQDAFKFGSITLNGVSGKEDQCMPDGKSITEYYCKDAQTYGGSLQIPCPNGCSNGACIATNTTAPVITALILPSTSSTTKVPLTIKADKSPVNYLMIDGPTPKDGLVPALPPKPLANDTRWLSIAPTSYNFTGIGSRTLFAWVKDVAGNVSESRSAVVAINQCPEIMPPVCQEGEVLTPQTGTGANGCPLPPICVATPIAVCPVYPPLPENWCRGTILPLPKDKNGCDLPPVCIL